MANSNRLDNFEPADAGYFADLLGHSNLCAYIYSEFHSYVQCPSDLCDSGELSVLGFVEARVPVDFHSLMLDRMGQKIFRIRECAQELARHHPGV